MVVKPHQLLLIELGVMAMKSNWWTVYVYYSMVQVAVPPI